MEEGVDDLEDGSASLWVEALECAESADRIVVEGGGGVLDAEEVADGTAL